MNLQDTYTNIKEIGSGGGGTVFQAYHVRMQKYVVLKKIHDFIQNDMEIRAELDILKNLRHSYLPTVLDFFEDNGSVYTVMDYISGESFENLLGKGVCFNQAQIVKYARQMGEVLVYLHGQNPPIVHGDIKPANIMLTPEDNICLIDFNISQVKNGSFTLNMGYTPGYASPEQVKMVKTLEQAYVDTIIRKTETDMGSDTLCLNKQNKTILLKGTDKTAVLDINNKTYILKNFDGTILPGNLKKHVQSGDTEEMESVPETILDISELMDRMDERSDIYSTGATIYALLFGKTPDPSVVFFAEEEMIGCSEGLAHLIHKCMEYEQEKRFQNATDYLKTVNNIAKLDKRYRRLVFRQELEIMSCMIGITGCILLSFLGHERMGVELVESYNVLLSEMEELRVEGRDVERLDELFVEAQEIFPDHAGAYYQKALYLYCDREYQKMISFIEKEVLEGSKGFNEEEMGDFYYLLANGCMELDALDKAIDYYKTAALYGIHDSAYYADYAIALAKKGRLDEAVQTLAAAVEAGDADDKTLLAQGEIYGRQGRMDDAEACFSRCISETKDDYVCVRAYIMWGKIYDREGRTVEELQHKAVVLEEGVNKVKAEYRAVVLEQLAQSYIDLGGMLGDGTQYDMAIEKLQMITELGWDTYVTHNNLGILYGKIKEYERAEQEFLNMLSAYGEDYRVYKRLAFLEIDRQASLDIKVREYRRFLEYYEKAKELFIDSGAQPDSDMEMQLLNQAYDQLLEGHWL